jgi:hypothetical protein
MLLPPERPTYGYFTAFSMAGLGYSTHFFLSFQFQATRGIYHGCFASLSMTDRLCVLREYLGALCGLLTSP